MKFKYKQDTILGFTNFEVKINGIYHELMCQTNLFLPLVRIKNINRYEI